MKRALLIGINAYNSLQHVGYAKNDAESVAEVLQNVYNFKRDEIVLMTDQSQGVFAPIQNNIEHQILSLRQINSLDFLLFGFWGHGVIDDQLKRYLCVQDTFTDTGHLQRTAISLDLILDVLKQTAAPQTCVLLDCCQNISAARGGAPALLTEKDCDLFKQGARDIVAASEERHHANQATKSAVSTTIIMNSCSATQRAYEWSDRKHGIFTAHLLEAMTATPRVAQWAQHISERVPLTALHYGHTQVPYISMDGGTDIQLPGFKGAAPGSTCPEVVISEDPNQVQIRDYKVGEIQIKFEKIMSSEEAAPTSEKVVLPAVSTEFRELQGELAGIEKLLKEVEAETASILNPAKDSIESASRQRDQIAQRQSELLEKLNPSDEERRQLEMVVNDQMDTTVSPVSLRSGKPNGMSMSNFVRLVLWQQKKIQSEEIVRKTEDEYTEKRAELIEELNQQKQDKLAHQQTVLTAFYDHVIDLILSVCPGYDNADAPVPYEELIPLLPLLDQYRLGLSDDEIWELSEKRWLENRPSVIKEKECLEREKVEQENQRLEQLRKSGLGDKAGQRRVETISGVEYAFRWCPPGMFLMGSPEDEKERGKGERQHKVRLTRGFWLLETPVTQLMWKSVMGTGFVARLFGGRNPSYFKGDNLPVEQVSWEDSQAFIGKLNGLLESSQRIRLPSEAEWEYACRAGTTTAFNFGGVLNGDQANCRGDFPYGTTEKGPFLGKTTAVKSYSPNAWGLYDMHGNVYEWCGDWYDEDYYANSPSTDPTGPDSGSNRVSRGGSWCSSAQNCRSANRGRLVPARRSVILGFRLALSSIH